MPTFDCINPHVNHIFLATAFCVALGLGCNHPVAPANASLPDNLPAIAIEPVTTALPENPLRKLPKGYVLDSASILDPRSDHRSAMHFPQHTQNEGLNAVIRAFCDWQAGENLPDLPRGAAESSQFAMWPIAMDVQADLLAIQFQDQSYYAGAAHFNHGYDCLNIDLQTNEELFFTDLFQFSKTHPKAAFCALFQEADDDRSSALTPDKLNAQLQYVILQDQLRLCFDDFERGPSQTTVDVPMDAVMPFLTQRARKILGLAK
jgi:hypothetical protein